MADIAGFDTVLFDHLEGDIDSGPTGKSYAPPPDGKYWGTIPVITDEAFGKTREGYLSVTVDPITIVNANGPGDEYAVRFTRLSGKKYSNKNTSQVVEFLRACGISHVPANAEEAVAYVKSCSGKTIQFALQWEAYDKDAQKNTRGMEQFPLLEDGTRQSWIPAEFDANQKVYANGKVRFFISAVK